MDTKIFCEILKKIFLFSYSKKMLQCSTMIVFFLLNVTKEINEAREVSGHTFAKDQNHFSKKIN